ncbi:LysR family transcriptional regulator [Dongshaea marina]|uniref:LysR family transcriptional regulator n=1 Tax=Dongshaea marina TaxID=2047966 RepID=UPI000D3ECDCB|nr:LysR family transcriptional regulator [Dongshaea marina]
MRNNKAIDHLYEMAILVQVVKTGSFSEAAKRLGLAPSSVSRSIKKLEAALNVCILQRTTRKFRLTEQGKQIHQHCLDMLISAEQAIETSNKTVQSPKGTLRIAVPKAVAYSFIHPHIPAFLELYPDINIHLILDDLDRDIVDQRIDIQFKITQSPPPGMMGRSMIPIQHVLCASHQYIKQRGTPNHPRDLANHSCLSLGQHPADAKWRFTKDQKSTQVDVTGRYVANHSRIRMEAALQHIGIASLPLFVAQPTIENGQLIHILPDWTFHTDYSGDLWILYASTKHQPAHLKAFVSFICDKLSKSSGPG